MLLCKRHRVLGAITVLVRFGPLYCRQPPFPLATWPAPFEELLEPATGRYTPASDLCLVAHNLLSDLPFQLSAQGATAGYGCTPGAVCGCGANPHVVQRGRLL